MKKLISIGVALALLTMAVVPGAVAAYDPPPTYAKVPFAIIASGIELVGNVLGDLQPIIEAMGVELPIDLSTIAPVTDRVAGWTAGPLSWTVDMLAWGLGLGADVWDLVDTAFVIGYPEIGELLDVMACGLMTCWSATNCTGEFTPCAGL